MKLIINIPDEYFEQIKNNTEGSTAESEAVDAIRNGMPYKENQQEDLISREALLNAMEKERQYLLERGQLGAEHILVHHCLPIIDNAPSVT